MTSSQVLQIAVLISILTVVRSDYITPIGEHICEGYIRDDSTQIVAEKVLMKEKYSEPCLSAKEFFRCTRYRDKYSTKLKKVDGPVTRKATVCCEGYKQIGDRCVYDKEYHNSGVLSVVFIVAAVLSSLLILVGIVIPTFLYLREKRRRIYLEDMEHDPESFRTSNAAHNNNIYTIPSNENGESLYECIDDKDQPPAYESCSVDGSSQVANYSRHPPPYAGGPTCSSFRQDGYDKLNFEHMKTTDMSYGNQAPMRTSRGYSKLQPGYSKVSMSSVELEKK